MLRALLATFFTVLLLAGCRVPGEHRPAQPALVDPTDLGVSLTGPIDFARAPAEDLVQLWVRKFFYFEDLALHPYFLAYDAEAGRWEQWEVWADEEALPGGTRQETTRQFSDGRAEEPAVLEELHFGTVRLWRNLTYFGMSTNEGLLAEWSGAEARRLLEVLRRPESYRDHERYRIWPGPNSNGYARAMLAEAGLALDLDPRMVGKDWYGPFGFGCGLTPTRTGVHLDLASFGCALGLRDGLELHALGATLGLDLWPPALKTPFGRLGWSE